MKYRVKIDQDEDGMFMAEVPEFPGCIAQGNTRREAMTNIHEAAQLYIKSMLAHAEPSQNLVYDEVEDG